MDEELKNSASGCIESIERLGLKPGTQLNIFCSKCVRSPLQVHLGKLDSVAIQKFLDSHKQHEGHLFGLSDGKMWGIEIKTSTEPILQPPPDPAPEPSPPSTPEGKGGLKEPPTDDRQGERKTPLPAEDGETQAQDHIESKELDNVKKFVLPSQLPPGALVESKHLPVTEKEPQGQIGKAPPFSSPSKAGEDEGPIEEIDIEDETWIKLYRELKKNPIYKDSVAVHLFTHLLLTANHKPNRFVFNKKEICVKRGQLITGIRQISKDTNISLWKIRDRLKLLNDLGMITQKTTHRFSIITICNYDYYQDPKEPLPHTKPPTEIVSKPHTDRTLTATNKNVKNVGSKKHYVEGSDELRLATLLLAQIQTNKKERDLSPFKQPDLQKWAREIDVMIRRDGRKPEHIERVIRWCQENDFWWKNILSTGKLRDQFDRLESEMAKKAGVSKGSSW